MACYHPLKGYRSAELTANGKRKIVFNRNHGFVDLPVTVPCGQCVGCRLERSRQWAIRCHHEASLHENNCFITLTYANEHLPNNGSLDLSHQQKFFKRLRKKYGPDIRFYACGEYGAKYGRPHYHACVFNHDFEDRTLWKTTNEVPLYRSKSLETLWPYGHSSVGNVTFQSAAYVARYIMKKVTGELADDHYTHVDQNGEIHDRKPEYTTMSRRPGIGALWLKKYNKDVYPDDFIVLNGKKYRPPKYYDAQYELTNPDVLKTIKKQRKLSTRQHAANNTPERLAVRETIQKTKLKLLPRDLS